MEIEPENASAVTCAHTIPVKPKRWLKRIRIGIAKIAQRIIPSKRFVSPLPTPWK